MIPAFEGRAALEVCLDSVLALAPAPARILVVDDASTDGSAEAARSPRCEVLVNPENLGFARTCNRGIERALQGDPLAILLLNQDTKVAPDLLERLVDFLREHPRAGVVGPKTLSLDPMPDGRARLLYAGAWRGRLPLLQRIPGIEQADEPGARTPVRVDYVWGHGMLLRTSALRAVGAFDPAFPMYNEDLDLCVRMREAGWEVWCEPGAVMWHDLPDGARAVASEYWRWACKVRGTWTFYRKHYGLSGGLALTPLTLGTEIAQLARRGHARAARHLLVACVRRMLRFPDDLRAPRPAREGR